MPNNKHTMTGLIVLAISIVIVGWALVSTINNFKRDWLEVERHKFVFEYCDGNGEMNRSSGVWKVDCL